MPTRGIPSIIVPAKSGLLGIAMPAPRSLSNTSFHRSFMLSFASTTMPRAFLPSAFTSGPIPLRTLSIPPLSRIQNSGSKLMRMQSCKITCLSSSPSTRSTISGGVKSPLVICLSDFYPLFGRGEQFFFRVLYGAQDAILRREAKQHTLNLLRFHCRLGEAGNTVRAMGSR